MNPKVKTLESYAPPKGESIYRAAKMTIELAKSEKAKRAILVFNGIKIECNSTASHLDIAEEYFRLRPLVKQAPKELQPEFVDE